MEDHTWTGSLRLEIRPVREAKSMFKLHYGVCGGRDGIRTRMFRYPYMDSVNQICLQTLSTKQEMVICKSGVSWNLLHLSCRLILGQSG